MTERNATPATAAEREGEEHEQALELLHGELRASADGGTWRAPLTRDQVRSMCREYDSLRAALLAARREVAELARATRFFVENFSIQGTEESERYDRAIALLNRAALAATQEER